ncbi:MAG: tRNA(Ile)(2)-agmatinylcytidine synthase, partial [Candidatus Korarchaeota archaeon]
MKIVIGLDSTDSPEGGCTTYTLAVLIKEVIARKIGKITEWPRLVRLNPNIPFKTRGNGAVALSLETQEKELLWNTILEVIEETGRGNNFGLVMFSDIPEKAHTIYQNALHTIVPVDEAIEVARMGKWHAAGNKQGIVGAVAAAGAIFNDRTWELLCYRAPANWKTPRKVDEKSVIEMDKKTRPVTFNNYDYQRKRMLITPHGPDPVLFGIRASSPTVLPEAFSMINIYEPIWGYIIFETNQGTDAHAFPKKIRECSRFDAALLTGQVTSCAVIYRGGHVCFSISDSTGEAEVWVYEPTGQLRKCALLLEEGDLVHVIGGVKDMKESKIIFNAEKIYFLGPEYEEQLRAVCSNCGSQRMKSKGKGIYYCKQCSYKGIPKYIHTQIPRKIKVGWYYPDRSAFRHLTRPPER